MPEGKGVLDDNTLRDAKLGRAEVDYSVSRLINSAGAAGGTTLPPRLIAGLRVPIVTGLKVEKIADFFGGTQITVSWLDSHDNFRLINGYNVYVQNLNDENPKPQGPYFSASSPATVRLVTDTTTVAVLTVQTLLNSGQTSDINISPSVAVNITAASSSPSDFDPNTVPVDALEDNPAGSLITWNAADEATIFGPGATDAILVGSGAGAIPQFKSRTTLNLVEGRSNLATATSIPFVASSGVLNEADELSWDNTGKTLTQTQPTLGTALQILQSTATNTDPNETLYQNKATTTNATPTTIHTITIPATTTVGFSGSIVARRTGGGAGVAEDGAFYTFDGVYKNVAGAATVIGSPIVTVVGEDQAGWDVTFNPTGATVEIQVTGAANNDISWGLMLRTYLMSS